MEAVYYLADDWVEHNPRARVRGIVDNVLFRGEGEGGHGIAAFARVNT